jgi:hypothetical protein
VEDHQILSGTSPHIIKNKTLEYSETYAKFFRENTCTKTQQKALKYRETYAQFFREHTCTKTLQ